MMCGVIRTYLCIYNLCDTGLHEVTALKTQRRSPSGDGEVVAGDHWEVACVQDCLHTAFLYLCS